MRDQETDILPDTRVTSMADAAAAAEAKLTEYLRSEVIRLDKECIRPLQVSNITSSLISPQAQC